jgi:hypothetical protein
MTIAVQPKRIKERTEKINAVYTPPHVADHIAQLTGFDFRCVLDPSVGAGALFAPYKAHDPSIRTIGCDINDDANRQWTDEFHLGKFEDLALAGVVPDLVVMNPPFNGARPKYYPEVFLRKVHDLWGNKIPCVMISPIHFRLNINWTTSSRYVYIKENWNITSICSMPRKIFPGHEVYAEILFFNIPNIPAHTML